MAGYFTNMGNRDLEVLATPADFSGIFEVGQVSVSLGEKAERIERMLLKATSPI